MALTRAELEYMTRMPNEIRALRKSIDSLVEVLKPISAAYNTEVQIDPAGIQRQLELLENNVKLANSH